ncbi:MAG: glycosyltransferase family 39 protein [Candidatus Gottesmanbacteria bacterium]
MKLKSLLLFIFLICIAAFLRLYKLSSIPPGLSQDETSIGYNAYAILQTGKDEHGVSYPQNFKAFGEYKLPGYIYLSTIPIAFLGPTPLAVRLPSAVLGVFTVLLMYFLVKELFSRINDTLPLIATALLAINPWHLHLSRGAFEVTVALFFITFAFLLWLIAKRRSSALFIGLSILFFALAGYTYNIARLLAPLSLVFLFITSYQSMKQFRIGSWIIIAIFGICSFAPMAIGMVQNGGVSSTSGTMMWSSAYVQAPLLEWRSYFSSWPITITRILFNKPLLTFVQWLQNVINFFSPTFFFTMGSLHGNHGIGTVGQWYLFETVTIILGIIYGLKKKIHSLIGFWIITTIAIVALTRESPHATRAFFIVIPVTILSALGIISLYTYISTLKSKYIKTLTYLFIIGICLYQIFSYFASYYVRFPILYAKPWRVGDKDVSLYIKNHESKYDKIIIDDKCGFMYSSLVYYLAYPPIEFQRDAKWNRDDSEGFSFPNRFGKYEFRAVNWNDDLNYPRTLIVTSHDQKPPDVPLLKTFYYPQRPVVFAVGQQIMQYPIADISYVLVEKK